MSVALHAEERFETRERSGPLLRRVRIRNYKSITSCDVELKPFTLLVGRNGAGKSNFLNALRFVAEGLDGAVGPRYWSISLSPWGGIAEWSSGVSDSEIELDFRLDDDTSATYYVRVGRRTDELFGIGILDERLDIRRRMSVVAGFHCRDGRHVESTIPMMPVATSDRLYLTRASSVPEFRPAYDALTGMAFYSLNPGVMRDPQELSEGHVLAIDGRNIPGVFFALETMCPEAIERIVSWLGIVVPEFKGVRSARLGPYLLLTFDCPDDPARGARSFSAGGVSDGTLRALGILVAVNQLASDGRPIRLVGIEEPETALHPAAAGALMDALREAATHTQVLVTTHSADLLDRYDPDEDHLLAVESRDGKTEIGPIDRASREVIRKRLYSAGELLRMDQIEVDRREIARLEADSPDPQSGEPR